MCMVWECIRYFIIAVLESRLSHVTLVHRYGDFPSTKVDSAGSRHVDEILMQMLALIDLP
jgi:hypothetical protein